MAKNQKAPSPRDESSPDGQYVSKLTNVQGAVKGDAGAAGGNPVQINFNVRARLGANQLDGRGAPPSSQSDFSVPGVPRGKGS